MQRTISQSDASSDSVKYMAGIDQWFDDLFKPRGDESDEDYRKRLLKSVKAKLIESFRSGKAQRCP
jgi:hypothetical protein